jgi:mRNA-degrading endonuclease toxin of MazEF toxin-antitoxin module
MRRGDIWTTSGGHDYAKPRLVAIIQDAIASMRPPRSRFVPSPLMKPMHRSLECP